MRGPDTWLGMNSIRFISHPVASLASTDLQVPCPSLSTPPTTTYLSNFLSPFSEAAAEVQSHTPVSKISSQGMNSQSYLCHPLSFTDSSEISSNLHYWQTRCFLVAFHFHTTGVCRQEKYSCYAAQTGLLCCFTRRKLAVECHTPPYHGLRAGTSIHLMHCVPRNFLGCCEESCCLLSELCKKSYSFS